MYSDLTPGPTCTSAGSTCAPCPRDPHLNPFDPLLFSLCPAPTLPQIHRRLAPFPPTNQAGAFRAPCFLAAHTRPLCRLPVLAPHLRTPAPTLLPQPLCFELKVSYLKPYVESLAFRITGCSRFVNLSQTCAHITSPTRTHAVSPTGTQHSHLQAHAPSRLQADTPSHLQAHTTSHSHTPSTTRVSHVTCMQSSHRHVHTSPPM